MNKPALLVLTSTFPRWQNDGEPAFIFDQCRQLTTRYRVTVLAPHCEGAAREEMMDGVNVLRFRYGWPEKAQVLAYQGGIMANLRRRPQSLLLIPFFFIFQLRAVVNLVRRDTFAAIHAHWVVPQGVVAWMASCVLGRCCPPYVLTAHGSDLNGLHGPLFRWLKARVLIQAAAVTVVSDSLRKQALGLGAEVRKTQVLPMAVDVLSRFVPNHSARDEDHLLFVGRLVGGKGCDVLIQALAMLAGEFPQLRLTIVGAGPCQNELSALVATLHLESRVKFVGHQPSECLPSFYRKVTLFVAPSLQEGFGLTVVEALACECPVVVSDLPVFREWLPSSVVAFVPPGDIGGTAKEISALLSDSAQRKKMGQKGRELVTQLFDTRVLTRKYVDVIDRVISSQVPHG